MRAQICAKGETATVEIAKRRRGRETRGVRRDVEEDPGLKGHAVRLKIVRGLCLSRGLVLSYV